MLAGASHTYRRIALIALAAGIFMLAMQLAGAFVGLSVNSFWLDELWTVVTIEPSSIRAVITRVTQDVHPPNYFILAHYWAVAFGLSETSLRMLSAICSIGAIMILLFGTSRLFRVETRLLAALVAATSPCWIEYSQAARMYGLGFLLGTNLAVLCLHMNADWYKKKSISQRDLACLVVVSFIYAFTHFYMFLACGCLMLALILIINCWPVRIIVAGAGFILFILMASYSHYLMAHSQVELQRTWFTNSLRGFVLRSWDGVFQQMRIEVIAVFVGMAAVLLWRERRALQSVASDPRLRGLAMMASVTPGLIAAGIVASLLLAPSFSGRNISVAAPFTWLAAALLIEVCLDRFPARWRIILFVAVVVAVTPGAVRIYRRMMPRLEEFRGASAFVQSIPQCRGQKIPVIRNERTAFKPAGLENERNLYGYYLNRSAAMLPFIDYSNKAEGVAPSAVIDLLRSRFAGRDPCPVLGIMVHVADPYRPARDLLRRAGSRNSIVQIKGFPHFERGTHQATLAWVFIVRRP